MKTITQWLAIAAIAALFGSASTFADDPQLQNRLAAQRQAQPTEKTTTIALYGHRKGVGKAARTQAAEAKVQERFTGHGAARYEFVK